MKLASLKSGRDGQLIVVNKNLTHAVRATEIAGTLQQALDSWDSVAPQLKTLYVDLNKGIAPNSFRLESDKLASPLPRAYQWLDGSAYVNHVELVRKARGAVLPESFWTDPLMYQGCSDAFVGPQDSILLESEDWGIDFESEVAVITDDVPMGVSAPAARSHVKLLVLVNDVSLRNLIPSELAKGLGFVQSKPTSAFSPVAVTPDEIGDDWREGKLHLPLRTVVNDKLFGQPNAGDDMTFDFGTLISHAAKTRFLTAGTILGGGTVSNLDRSRGSSCIAEKRMLETISSGTATTSFLKFGDRVKIEMFSKDGASVFGAIDQAVERYSPPKVL